MPGLLLLASTYVLAIIQLHVALVPVWNGDALSVVGGLTPGFEHKCFGGCVAGLALNQRLTAAPR